MNSLPLATWSTHVDDKHGSPFRTRFKVEQVGGRKVVTHLCLEPNPHYTGEPRGITTSDLAKIKPKALIAQDEAFTRLLLGERSAVRPTRYGPAEYEVIRDVLIKCADPDERRSPHTVLKALWGIEASTANRLIRKAREMFPDAPRATRGPKPRKDAS